MTIDADALREHVETDLADPALDRLIADAYDAIAVHVGPADAGQVDRYAGGDRFLFLSTPIADDADIDSIVEDHGGDTTTTLDPSDWRWWPGSMRLERLGTGPNGAGAWAPTVVVTFDPSLDADRRDRVVIDLCKLAIQYNALRAQTTGDFRGDAVEYQREREKLIGELRPRKLFA